METKEQRNKQMMRERSDIQDRIKGRRKRNNIEEREREREGEREL